MLQINSFLKQCSLFLLSEASQGQPECLGSDVSDGEN